MAHDDAMDAEHDEPEEETHGPSPIDTPTPGMVLAGKYCIERVLGSGGIAVVAAAYHLQLHRRVAIKYLLVEALECPEIVERFTREARAAARIRGEHVARVLDVGTFDDGAPFIVLEYLDGIDLAEHLHQRGPLPIGEAIRYVLETCEALAEAHAAKIVHRDLKPANLFLAKGPDHRRTIKVLDFGVSKLMDEPMTDPTRMLGTAMYMSPEQLRVSSAVDLRTDIWSLGVILFELLAGVAPFQGETVFTTAHAIFENKPARLSTLRPEVPPELEAVILRCLQTEPKDRYASVLELATELAPFASSRDRDSVRTIAGVLCGSIAPPPPSIAPPAVLTSPLPPPPPTPSALRDPSGWGQTPPPLESDAPMTTPLTPPPPQPQPSVYPPAGYRTALVWLATIAVTLGVAIGARMAFTQVNHATTKPPPSMPSEITLHVTSGVPGAQVRIDDGPPFALPLEKQVPRDDREHRIVVEADDHVSHTWTVRFTGDLFVSAPLVRK